jgi:FPC/CPF motif-containing protein YcgG
MPQRRRAPVRLPVRFDDLAFAEDLRHATPAGRDVARAARARFEHDGAELGELAPCDPEHRGGTRCPAASRPIYPPRATAGG